MQNINRTRRIRRLELRIASKAIVASTLNQLKLRLRNVKLYWLGVNCLDDLVHTHGIGACSKVVRPGQRLFELQWPVYFDIYPRELFTDA